MARMLLPLVALAQFLAPALPALGIGTPIGEAARADYAGLPPEQPVGFAFAIWGLIFALYAMFAVHAALTDRELTRRLAPPLAAAGAFNVLWMLSAQLLDSQLLNAVILLPGIWFAYQAAGAFDRMRGLGGDLFKFVADATTGLLAGWLAVAVAISTPLSLRTLTGLGASDAPWQMLFIALAVAGASAYLFTTRVSRSLWFFAALGWGVACVALNNWFVTGMPPLAVITAVIGIAIVRFRLTRGANGFRRSSYGAA